MSNNRRGSFWERKVMAELIRRQWFVVKTFADTWPDLIAVSRNKIPVAVMCYTDVRMRNAGDTMKLENLYKRYGIRPAIAYPRDTARSTKAGNVVVEYLPVDENVLEWIE